MAIRQKFLKISIDCLDISDYFVSISKAKHNG